MEEVHCVYKSLKSLLERNLYDPCRDLGGTWIDIYRKNPTSPLIHIPGSPSLAGVKARILSHGLVFFYTFLHEMSPITHEGVVKGFYFPYDEFLLPAISSLKNGYALLSNCLEAVAESNSCPWADNHGANTANTGWRYFGAVAVDERYSFACG